MKIEKCVNCNWESLYKYGNDVICGDCILTLYLNNKLNHISKRKLRYLPVFEDD